LAFLKWETKSFVSFSFFTNDPLNHRLQLLFSVVAYFYGKVKRSYVWDEHRWLLRFSTRYAEFMCLLTWWRYEANREVVEWRVQRN
jgi:hypothetical protein